jgi:hypothetical protein
VRSVEARSPEIEVILTMAAARVAHQRGRRLRAQKRSGEIDRQHARPVLVRDVEDRLEDSDAGIVDQRIEPAEFFGDGRERAGDARGIGDIAYKRERDVWFVQRCESALQILAVDIEQHHAPAVGEKSLGGRQSDPTRRSGHQCDLLCCFAHRPSPQPVCRIMAGHVPAIACIHCCLKDADARHKDALPSSVGPKRPLGRQIFTWRSN